MRVSVLGKQLCKQAARGVCPVSIECNPCRDVCQCTRNLLEDEAPQAEESCVHSCDNSGYTEVVQGAHVCDPTRFRLPETIIRKKGIATLQGTASHSEIGMRVVLREDRVVLHMPR